MERGGGREDTCNVYSGYTPLMYVRVLHVHNHTVWWVNQIQAMLINGTHSLLGSF